MGRKTAAFVEGVGLHDMVDVRQAVEAVGRSVETGVGEVRERELVSEWGRKQGGLD